ncbi:MAG: PilZ domain-containing protein [Elusimicrobia bacterium]|nr:PilZ domain-containing protein [Elusimicrobiota bacterium]
MTPKKPQAADTDNKFAERRRFARFPVMSGVVEPITVNFDANDGPGASQGQPAILTNLSAGGMSLILFLEPPRTKKLEMLLSIPGLDKVSLEGKVVRVSEKGQTYNVGIAFTKISKKHQKQLSLMAQDHGDCDMRIALRLPEACVSSCHFHDLCAKPQKGPYW